jgi:hypothetical protein
MLILPVISVLEIIMNRPANVMDVVGMWFLFYAVGWRCFTAGLSQVIRPSFTARQILQLRDPHSSIIVRELGFANISTGLAGIISLLLPSWRIATAFIGGLFLGIAGLQHILKGSGSANEKIPLITDIIIFLIMAMYITTSIL